MKLRTISQLPRLSEEEPLKREALIEIADPVGSGLYTSRSTTVGQLSSNMLSSFQDDLATKHGLQDAEGNSLRLDQVKSLLD